MGDFADDYGGYDMLGLYERRDEERAAQRSKLLTLPRKPWVKLTDEERASFEATLPKTQKEWDELFDGIEASLKDKNT